MPTAHRLRMTDDVLYARVITLATLGAAGFIVASISNLLIGSTLAMEPESLSRSFERTPPGEPQQRAPALAAFLERNLFGARIVGIEAVAEVTRDCQPSTSGLKLVATVVAADPRASVAMFVDANQSIGSRIGDVLVDEAELVAIDRRTVEIRRNGRCERLTLDEATQPPEVRPSIEVEPELGAEIKRVSEDQFEIPRATLTEAFGNLHRLKVRVVPSFHQGKANGFKVFGNGSGNLLGKVGIENGDIVQRIDGFEITDAGQALEVYGKLKSAESVTVDLVRRGKPTTLNYRIR